MSIKITTGQSFPELAGHLQNPCRKQLLREGTTALYTDAAQTGWYLRPICNTEGPTLITGTT
jgi:hypothetical protein